MHLTQILWFISWPLMIFVMAKIIAHLVRKFEAKYPEELD